MEAIPPNSTVRPEVVTVGRILVTEVMCLPDKSVNRRTRNHNWRKHLILFGYLVEETLLETSPSVFKLPRIFEKVPNIFLERLPKASRKF